MTPERRFPLALAVLLLAIKGYFASITPLSAGEAETWAQSHALELGSPAVQVLLAALRPLGPEPLALRAPALLVGLALPLMLAPLAKDRALTALIATLALPVLVGTTLVGPLATASLGAALALVGATQGGRGWLLAGLGGAFAAEAGLPGALLLPMLVVGSGELRSPLAWAALALAAPAVALHPPTPLGTSDLPGLAAAWVGWGGGLLGLAALGAASPAGAFAVDRAARLAWWGSAPLLGLATLAAAFGYDQPAWIAWPALAVLFGRREPGSLPRAAATGAWLSGLLGLALAAQVHRPFALLPEDPGPIFTMGPVLAGPVATWVAPVAGQSAPRELLVTEPEDAALVRFYAGLDPALVGGCVGLTPLARRLWDPAAWTATPVAVTAAPDALLLVPEDPAPLRCVGAKYPSWRPGGRISGRDEAGRAVGSWQVFEPGR